MTAIRAAGLRVDVGPGIGPLDLELDAGEYMLLVGPSGSGKTTLLRALAGLVRPSAGSVELFGTRVSDGPRTLVAPERRGIGMVFQGGALWPHMSVERTLNFTLSAARVPKEARAQRISELLAWVELTGFERRMPGTLSGGEAQRLALARALSVRPRLLLLDEPLGPLDAVLRGALIARLGELQRELGLTVVHVTHDPAEAAALASRALRLDAGRLQAIDLPASELRL